uniref:Uncharacterized protein n=1 Tax=Echinococcus granulosus TaxID=6210 RepID=A0A068WMM6_ECHGR|nr:hypothetical protein EgrG_000677400 [Echinococcus granulosus]
MEQVVTSIPAESLGKQLQNPSKKGVNKLFRQFRNLGWVKKLQSPKPDAKKHLDGSSISIVNANTRYEYNESEHLVSDSPLDECNSGCRPLCLPLGGPDSPNTSSSIGLVGSCQLTTFPILKTTNKTDEMISGYASVSHRCRIGHLPFHADPGSVSTIGGTCPHLIDRFYADKTSYLLLLLLTTQIVFRRIYHRSSSPHIHLTSCKYARICVPFPLSTTQVFQKTL